ncbi:hypothetical protein Tco_0097407 [Tanacetum coccineum]
MKKVIKEEFEKLESLKIDDVSLTYNTPLGIFHNKFNQMSRMDDDLFTYEVEIIGVSNIPCDLNEEDDSEQRMSHETNDDMEYDPSNVEFTERLPSKNFNYKMMDHYTKKTLWIYWSRGDDKVMCLLKILRDSRLTKIIRIIGFTYGIKMFHGYMKNHRRMIEHGKNPLQLNIIVSLSIIKMDVQTLKDGKIKEEALKNKAIMEGIIEDEDNELSNEGWRRWNVYENTNHGHEEKQYEMEHENKGICELFDDQEWLVCNIRRFEMIKYSFKDDEEYVAVKEYEYDDLTSISEDGCRAYQEIFHKMDEGWMKDGW